MAVERRLDIIVAAKNFASAALAKIRADMEKFGVIGGKQLGFLGAGLKVAAFAAAANRVLEFANGVGEAAKQLDGLTGQWERFSDKLVSKFAVLSNARDFLDRFLVPGKTAAFWKEEADAADKLTKEKESQVSAQEKLQALIQESQDRIRLSEVSDRQRIIVEGQIELEKKLADIKKQGAEAKSPQLEAKARQAAGDAFDAERLAKLQKFDDEQRKKAEDAAKREREEYQRRAEQEAEFIKKMLGQRQEAEDALTQKRLQARGKELEAELAAIDAAYRKKLAASQSSGESDALRQLRELEKLEAIGKKNRSEGVKGGVQTFDATSRYVGLSESFAWQQKTANATEGSLRSLERLERLVEEAARNAGVKQGGIPLGGG